MNFNVSVPDDLVKSIDSLIPSKYTTRSAFITEAVREKLKQIDL